MKKNINRPRKKLIINPKFQFFFMFFMSFVSFIAISISYLSSFSFFWKLKQLGIKLGIPNGSPFFQYIEQQEVLFGKILFGSSIGLFLLALVIGVIFSHRICGPLLRLEKHMLRIASGKEIAKIHFRKMDFFPEIATAFNAMMDRVLKKNNE